MDRIVPHRWILISVALAVVTVFALDLFLPAAIAVPMLYVPVLVVVARLASERATWIFFFTCAGFTAIGIWVALASAGQGDALLILVNRAGSLAIGAAVAWLALRGRRMESAWRDSLDTVRRSETQLRRFVENLPAAVAMFDREMCYLAHSRRWTSDLHLHVDSLVGRCHYDVFPNLPQRWKDAHRLALAGQTVCSDYDTMEHADGRIDLQRWEVRPWYTTGNAIGGVLLISERITERSRIEHDLRDSEALYRSLVENIPLYLARCDLSGRILFANRRYCELLGRPLEKLLGSTLDDHYPAQYAARSHEEDRHVVETGATLETIERHPLPKGEPAWIHVVKSPVRDYAGRITGTQVVFWDVTAQRRAEEELRRSERDFRALAENLPDIVSRFDRGLRHLYINPPIVSLTGLPTEAFLGKTNMDLGMPDELVALWNEKIKAAFDTGQSQSLEFTFPEASGNLRHFESRIVPERASDGTVETVLAISRDVTGRIAAQEQAQLHLAHLAHVGRLTTMGEMVSEIAHEINQPLHAIANFTEASINVLQSTGGEGAENRGNVVAWLKQVSEQATRAAEIIRRAGRFVRKTPARRSTVDVNDLVRDCLRLITFDLRFHSVKLRCELANSLPTVLADSIQVQQVLVNLLRNAVDAMSANEGDDRRLWVQTLALEQGGVQVSVRDNGRGIAAENADRLFEPFFSTKPDGMGMGLAVSHSIIEGHAGRLWAEPNAERGVTFHFTLPARKEEPHDVFCHI